MSDIHKKDHSLAKKVAYGGIINLLTLVSLYFASILPTSRLFFFGISTVFLAIIVIEFGVLSAIYTYISISILGLIINYNKLTLIPYIMFFGYYAIIKYYIEKINNLIIEWIIKLMLFNVAIIMMYMFMKNVLIGNIDINLPLWVIVIVAQVIFIVYDYCYSIAIWYFRSKLRKMR